MSKLRQSFNSLSAVLIFGELARPATAINDCVISGPDPGAVPGASTGGQKTEHRYRKFLIPVFCIRFSAFRRGRNRIDGRVKADLSLGIVPPLSGYSYRCQR